MYPSLNEWLMYGLFLLLFQLIYIHVPRHTQTQIHTHKHTHTHTHKHTHTHTQIEFNTCTLCVTGKQLGTTVLFFGCRNKAHDYLYEEELNQYMEDGVLSKLFVAFSRDQVCMRVCTGVCVCVCVFVRACVCACVYMCVYLHAHMNNVHILLKCVYYFHFVARKGLCSS